MDKTYDHSHPIRDALSVASVIIVLLLSSCRRNNDPLIGHWTVERVNVEFDEGKATPEMVRQFGELEKGNVVEITQDSVLTFVSGRDTLRGQCSLRGETLYFNGTLFGKVKEGVLVTESLTPMGKVKVMYKKS